MLEIGVGVPKTEGAGAPWPPPPPPNNKLDEASGVGIWNWFDDVRLVGAEVPKTVLVIVPPAVDDCPKMFGVNPAIVSHEIITERNRMGLLGVIKIE